MPNRLGTMHGPRRLAISFILFLRVLSGPDAQGNLFPFLDQDGENSARLNDIVEEVRILLKNRDAEAFQDEKAILRESSSEIKLVSPDKVEDISASFSELTPSKKKKLLMAAVEKPEEIIRASNNYPIKAFDLSAKAKVFEEALNDSDSTVRKWAIHLLSEALDESFLFLKATDQTGVARFTDASKQFDYSTRILFRLLSSEDQNSRHTAYSILKIKSEYLTKRHFEKLGQLLGDADKQTHELITRLFRQGDDALSRGLENWRLRRAFMQGVILEKVRNRFKPTSGDPDELFQQLWNEKMNSKDKQAVLESVFQSAQPDQLQDQRTQNELAKLIGKGDAWLDHETQKRIVSELEYKNVSRKGPLWRALKNARRLYRRTKGKNLFKQVISSFCP